MATKIKKRNQHKHSAPDPPKSRFLVSAELTKQYKSQIMEAERQTVMDFVSIALGRMGFRASRFQKFRETLAEVYMDYAELIAEVKQDDPQLWEVFGKIDRELLQYTGKEMFEPWEKRHG